MGRYYTGDIEGKFWFGVQASNDGEFFGAIGSEPRYIDYYVDDIKKVEDGIKKCLEELGEYKDKINEFFKNKELYTNKELAEYLEVNEIKTKNLLKWYARLEIGNKIFECMKEQGYCSFEAEI